MLELDFIGITSERSRRDSIKSHIGSFNLKMGSEGGKELHGMTESDRWITELRNLPVGYLIWNICYYWRNVYWRVKCDDGEFLDVNKEGHSVWSVTMGNSQVTAPSSEYSESAIERIFKLTKCILKELIRVRCDGGEFPDVNKEGHSEWNKEMPVSAYSSSLRNTLNTFEQTLGRNNHPDDWWKIQVTIVLPHFLVTPVYFIRIL